MIALSDPSRPLDRSLLEVPGGFAWWYLDLVDEAGDGLVLIWSFGLPFLPGYTDAARRGRPERPGRRPSLNVALYQGGRCTFYLLQEHDPEDVSWTPGTERCRFGTSVLESSGGPTLCRVDAHLDCPLPGTPDRLVARVTAEGPRVAHDGALPAGDHHWTPLLVAPGEAEVTVGGRPLAHLSGRVYHDRNGSRRALDALGIHHWIWGRATVGDTERIWYLLWPVGGGAPRALGLEIGPDGRARGPFDLRVEREDARRARYGMDWWGRLVLRRGDAPWLEVTHRRPVDDGPFYLRFPVEVTAPEGTGRGLGEAVRPERVDRPWMQPQVRMRVHRAQGGNSLFAPLFTGTADGRVRRLLGLS